MATWRLNTASPTRDDVPSIMSIEHGSAQEVRFARVASGARIASARSGRPGAPTLVRRR